MDSPPNGTLKVNVHGDLFAVFMPNGNISGIEVVLHNSNDSFVNCILGVISGLTNLVTQPWAVLVGLHRAFLERSHSVIL